MQITASNSQASSVKGECILIPIDNKKTLSGPIADIDKASQGAIKKLIKAGDISNKKFSSTTLFNISGIPAKRIIIVGLGDPKKLKLQDLPKVYKVAFLALRKTGASQANSFLHWLRIDNSNNNYFYRASETVQALQYQFTDFKSNPVKHGAIKFNFALDKANQSQKQKINQAIKDAKALSEGVNLCKDLGNLPGNVCTPSYIANEAKKLSEKHPKLSLKVIDEKSFERLGMGAFLSVSKGSEEPGKLIILNYQGTVKSEKPHVLVGKGITFDTGGISLKPGAGMDEMKYDMCGAASVMGTMKTVAESKLKLNVIGVIAAAENMPDGKASKPGDIVTTMSGKTVEILNTDAEGRLVLCDALTYVERFSPASVIDIATLTGACVMALGHHATALYSNNEKLAENLQNCGDSSGDRVWPMPLWDEYQAQLKSPFADLANIGGRPAGSVTAACFLANFAKKYQWAHLDIAGTAWNSGANKGSTGRPVPLLTEYLRTKAK